MPNKSKHYGPPLVRCIVCKEQVNLATRRADGSTPYYWGPPLDYGCRHRRCWEKEAGQKAPDLEPPREYKTTAPIRQYPLLRDDWDEDGNG